MADRDLIAEGRAKLAVATPAPWDTDPHAHMEKGCRCASCYDSATVTLTTNMLECQEIPAPADQTRCEQSGYTWEDAELIVWARNNLAALLDGLEAVERERDEAHMELADLRIETETNYGAIAEKQRRDNARINAYRDAMRDVRRILADFGITNPPPRLAAVLEVQP